MTARIFVTTQVEGIHQWSAAPDEVYFLRTPHRHMFHWRVEMDVNHDDREQEFILVKNWLTSIVPQGEMEELSCEQMCKYVYGELKDKYGERNFRVEVSEDGENGAILTA